VSNVGTVPTSGTVTVTDVLPPGLTAVSIGGTGWNCAQPTGPCTRGDVLAPGASWPPIVLTVNIAPDAPSPIENTALVVGGGDANGANNSAKNVVNLQPTQPAATVEAIPVNDPLALALAALLMLMAGGYRLARRR